METNYKRTVAGSVGSGVTAVFNASDRKYYILEHKTNSAYHRAGDSQKIIVDQIEMGRDANCQVRFDETFETVSRKHAAIVKDGENWKLIPLSQTNPTFVNGQPVTGEWHLNSGDEIRLSANGPIMGFIVPQGKAALASSIAFTERMSLFRKQALRPYKFAIAIIVVALIGAIAGLVLWSNDKDKSASAEIAALKEAEMLRLKDAQAQAEAEKVYFAELENCNNAVYYVRMQDVVVYGQDDQMICRFNTEDMVGGTGFMLSDGRFVTAHRVVEPWFYYQREIGNLNGVTWTFNDIQALANGGCKVVATFTAYSPAGASFQFRNSEMVMTRPDMQIESVSYRTKKNSTVFAIIGKTTVALNYYNNSRNTDWAFMMKKDQFQNCKGLLFDNSKSLEPVVQEEVKIMGYPNMTGNVDPRTIQPTVFTNNVNVTGLNKDGLIELASNRYQPGVSGGPVLIKKDGLWTVVGILCETDRVDRDIVLPIDFVK